MQRDWIIISISKLNPKCKVNARFQASEPDKRSMNFICRIRCKRRKCACGRRIDSTEKGKKQHLRRSSTFTIRQQSNRICLTSVRFDLQLMTVFIMIFSLKNNIKRQQTHRFSNIKLFEWKKRENAVILLWFPGRMELRSYIFSLEIFYIGFRSKCTP